MENLNRDSASKGTVNLNQWGLRVALIMAATIALAAPAVAQQYTITDLGALSATGDTDSFATAINASGSVVGYSGKYDASENGFLYTNAFVWTPSSPNSTTGKMSYLGGLPGVQCIDIFHSNNLITLNTYASDINSAGQVVGESGTSNGTCPTASIDGALWQNGAATDLSLLAGSGAGHPVSINDKGQIVGWTETGSSTGNIWLWDGSYHILGNLPGAVFGTANKINNSEITVGQSGNLGFQHTGNGPLLATDAIGTLGGLNSAAYGINNSGNIVGTADTLVASHAFWINKTGQMIDLGTATSDPSGNSGANAINNNNNIVGVSDVNPAAAWNSCQHAAMWESGGNLIDLNTLLAPTSPPVKPPVGTPNICSDPFHLIPSTKTCATCWELITATGINDLGQIVGEGFLNGQRHAFLLTPGCISAGGDTDGDGLCDDWEKNGYTAPDGTFIDLPAMGADPNHKDIFVQADYLEALETNCYTIGCAVSYLSGHTHKPSPAAMAAVTAAFANAPVNNPDGTTGITLHVDCGPDCIMNPLTGDVWGTRSKAQNVAETFPILGGPIVDGNCVALGECFYDWTDFQNIKGADFLPTDRAPIFHYVLFAHDIGIYGPGGVLKHTSGTSASTPASDFIVSLGNYKDYNGTDLQQAGTFMHELGHNLGLQHGGLDGYNHKPNYLSVMNYSFQMDGLFVGGLGGWLDYSKFLAIPSLNENALNNFVGLGGGAALAGYGIRYYCLNIGALTGNLTDFTEKDVYFDVNGPINWGCLSGAVPQTVVADINGDEDTSDDMV